MEKEIENPKLIGYRFKSQFSYLENIAAELAIPGCVNRFTDSSEYKQSGIIASADYKYSIQNLAKAGVLDLWFVKVYEPSYKVGDWVVLKEFSSVGSRLGKITGVKGDILSFNNKHGNVHVSCITRIASQQEVLSVTQSKSVLPGGIHIIIKKKCLFVDGSDILIEDILSFRNRYCSLPNIGKFRVSVLKMRVGCVEMDWEAVDNILKTSANLLEE